MNSMNETKRIIVEFGARRQQFTLTDQRISTVKLQQLIGDHFGVKLDRNSIYTLQMYDYTSKEYYPLNEDRQIFTLMEDIAPFHRFRIVKTALISQKNHLLDNLQSTVGKLHHATENIGKIQNLLGTLNHNCDVLNQLMDIPSSKTSPSASSYLLDPSMIRKNADITKEPDGRNELDDENFDSVSCYESIRIDTINPPPSVPIPIIINLHKQQLSTADNNIQTRIIPCKYAVRGTCHLGDKCLYLHDDVCIEAAREWERRL